MGRSKDDWVGAIKEGQSYLEISESMGALEEALYAGGELVIWLTSDCIGSEKEGLGCELMKELLSALSETGTNLRALIMSNRAVLLGEEEANHVALQRLERQGVGLLYCTSSVQQLGIEPVLGRQVTMFHIVQVILGAKRVVCIG